MSKLEKQQKKLAEYISTLEPLYSQRLKVAREIGKLKIESLLDNDEERKKERIKVINELDKQSATFSKQIRDIILQNSKEEKSKDETGA